MSRIGRAPITIPANTTVAIDGLHAKITGPKGELERTLPEGFKLEQTDTELKVIQLVQNRTTNAQFGLQRTLLANAVIGVTDGFSKQLIMNGVGFRVEKKGEGLSFSLGLSHKVEFVPDAGIELKIEGNVITVSGIDKQAVGLTAARIRDLKKPEPYKGKGIKYSDEHIRRKAGKAAAKAA